MLLTRYFAKRLLLVTLLVALLLCGLILLAQSLRFIDFVLNRGAPMVLFLKLMLSMLPSFLLVILPLSITIAVLTVYNSALKNREIVIMQTAGLNLLALSKPVLLVSLIIAAVVLFIAMVGMPVSQKIFRDKQYELRNGYAISLLQDGTFTEITKNIVLYVGGRKADGTVENMVIYDNRKPVAPVITTAETGQLIIVDNMPRIAVANSVRQQFNRETGKFSSLSFESYVLDLAALMPIKQDRKFSDKEKRLTTLLKGDRQERAAAHGRLVQVLLTLCLPMIAAGILLQAQFSRHSLSVPMVTTIVLAIALWSSTIVLKQLILTQPVFGVTTLYTLPIATMLIALFRKTFLKP